jgi:uncharacterized protein (DUF2384 family)
LSSPSAPSTASQGEQLSRDESERGVRLANLLLLAEQVLGEQDIATAWLRQPLQRFDAHHRWTPPAPNRAHGW